LRQIIHVSATPGDYELAKPNVSSEQLIRPTGLLDPRRGASRRRARSTTCSARSACVWQKHERVLVTTLTKRMAEDLTEYLRELGIKVRYLHSDVETPRADRAAPRPAPRRVRRARRHQPAARRPRPPRGRRSSPILDADKEGFLRKRTSLIQTCGRAARNVDGKRHHVCRPPKSMQACIEETQRRRIAQALYNQEHGIVPRSTHAPINSLEADAKPELAPKKPKPADVPIGMGPLSDGDLLPEELNDRIAELKAQMSEMAKALRYEEAAKLRDRVRVLEARKLEFI
jgi:excinuclease ABC subunit B